MKLWIGKEQEGKNKGVQTLFIASEDVSDEDISDVLKEHKDIKQLYFGAGCCTPINEYVVDKCIHKFNSMIITLEVEINKLYKYSKHILSSVNLMITVNNEGFKNLNYCNILTSQIKLQHIGKDEKILLVGDLNDFVFTDMTELDGVKYKDDKVIY